MGVLVVAAGVEGLPHLLAQAAVVRIGQEGIDRGAGVQHRPLALVALVGGGCGRGVLHRLGQAREVGLLQVEDVAALVGQQVLAELCVEARQLLVDGGDPRLGGGGEPGAALHPVDPVVPGQLLLLRRQARGLARLVDRVDAGEQAGVLADPVLELGDLGVHHLLHRLHVGVVFRGAPHAVKRHHPAERLARPLLGYDGVVEGGRGRVAGDGIDLRQVLAHALLKRRLEGGDLHLGEGRQAAVRPAPGREQGLRVGREVCGRRAAGPGLRRRIGGGGRRATGVGLLGDGRRGEDHGQTGSEQQDVTHCSIPPGVWTRLARGGGSGN